MEKKLIQHCVLKIEEKLNWGDSKSWHSDVFDELSALISTDTGILLSPTTLKRVWGKVKYESAPSISTLNALSQFAGYTNWREFKQHESPKPPLNAKTNVPYRPVLVYTFVAFLIALIATLFAMIGTEKSSLTKANLALVNFKSRPIAVGIPNSVVFDFDLAGIKSDNILIQQYWDETKTIQLSSDQKQATGIYYFPGYFRSKLIIDGLIIKEHDLFIKSDGWLGMIEYDPIGKYLKHEEVYDKGILSFNSEIFDEIISSNESITSSFHFINDLGAISGDNFQLKASLKSLYQEKWAVCQSAQIYVIGSSGAFIVPFSIPGCTSNNNLMLNDIYFNGKENDLSGLGVDMSDFTDINITVENKNMSVIINGNNAYNASYNDTMGKLVGLRFKFQGVGEVKNIELSDSNSSLIELVN